MYVNVSEGRLSQGQAFNISPGSYLSTTYRILIENKYEWPTPTGYVTLQAAVILENAVHADGKAAALDCLVINYAVKVANT